MMMKTLAAFALLLVATEALENFRVQVADYHTAGTTPVSHTTSHPQRAHLTPSVLWKFDIETKEGPGSFVVAIEPSLAPIGAARFRELVEALEPASAAACHAPHSASAWFRQSSTTTSASSGSSPPSWFSSGSPATLLSAQSGATCQSMTSPSRPVMSQATTLIDSILHLTLRCSTHTGYITFAKTGAPNSRTTQLFINYANNANLDGMGFAPFGKVEGNGMDVVTRHSHLLGWFLHQSTSPVFLFHPFT